MSIEILNGFAYRVQNFVTKEEQEILLREINQIESWNSYDNGSEWWSDKSGAIYHVPESAAIYQRVLGLFQNYIKIDPIDHVNRLRPGQFMGTHHDAAGHEAIKFGVVIYLNDNFDGGELYYPDHNFIVKPIERSLVIHPGDIVHEVTTLNSGVRYALTTFVHGDKNTKINIDGLSIDS